MLCHAMSCHVVPNNLHTPHSVFQSSIITPCLASPFNAMLPPTACAPHPARYATSCYATPRYATPQHATPAMSNDHHMPDSYFLYNTMLCQPLQGHDIPRDADTTPYHLPHHMPGHVKPRHIMLNEFHTSLAFVYTTPTLYHAIPRPVILKKKLDAICFLFNFKILS